MNNTTSTLNVSSTSNPFYATRAMFINHTAYNKPLSYEEWMNLSAQHKAAVLYVQFFDQITLAWYKVRSFYAQEEDGVSTIMQYLIKNVPVIEKNPKRFTPNYIYRVAFNCLYCICHDIQRDRLRWELECSNLVSAGEEVLDLFDTVSEDPDFVDGYSIDSYRERFWDIIEDMDKDTQTVIAEILDNKSNKLSEDRKAEVLQHLRDALAPFKKIFNI